MKFKAVIFDMDGVLVDSMIYWLESDKEFFPAYGIELTDELVRFFTGKSETEIMRWFKKEFNLKETVEELLYKRDEITNDIYTTRSELMPGVDGLVRKIGASNMKQAIASGAAQEGIRTVIDRFGWKDHFDITISVEDVGHRGKPEPDVYLHTADKLNILPEDCIVFEDAENGVLSAKAAGMKCIAVTDERWSFGDFSSADLHINSLDDKRVLDYLGL